MIYPDATRGTQRILPVAIHEGAQILPVTNVETSPCKARPDSAWGQACPLLDWSKSNNVCMSCHLRAHAVFRPVVRTIEQIEQMIATSKVIISKHSETREEVATHDPGRLKECTFDGCDELIAKGLYCSRCHSLRAQRKKTWRQKYGPDSVCPESVINAKRRNENDPRLKRM